VFGVMGWRYGLQNQAFISLELHFHVHGDFGLVVEMEKVRRQSGFGGGGAAAATVDVVGGRSSGGWAPCPWLGVFKASVKEEREREREKREKEEKKIKKKTERCYSKLSYMKVYCSKF
jgi:hypothetical protein